MPVKSKIQNLKSKMVLTLLSDFGLQDTYVGVMKGVIAQIAPELTVVDLTHEIPPQNIAAARFNVMSAYPFFPAGTVHVAVVDPGVGSRRRAIALQLANGFLVGPDNGIFSGVLSQQPVITAVELTNPQYWRTPHPSHTFHGRDIFAPVGAYLATGTPIQELGRAIASNTLTQMPLSAWTQTATEITGCIQYIDHFGNLITNIPGDSVQDKNWSVKTDQLMIPGQQTYADCPMGHLLALIGSHGWIEIAVNGDSAQSKLQMNWGDLIRIELQP